MLSFAENIPTILHAVITHGAKRILDIGPGHGKYGLLIREEYLSLKAAAGELVPTDDLILDCVEPTPFFNTRPPLLALYNRVYAQDVFDLATVDTAVFNSYDLALMIDVVEHFDKSKVLELLKGFNTDVLISTPKAVTMYTQKYYDDPNHHKSQWSLGDFVGLGDIKDYSTPLSHIVLITKRTKGV